MNSLLLPHKLSEIWRMARMTCFFFKGKFPLQQLELAAVAVNHTFATLRLCRALEHPHGRGNEVARLSVIRREVYWCRPIIAKEGVLVGSPICV